MPPITPLLVVAALLALAPYLAAAFFPARVTGRARSLPPWAQIAAPALLAIPYVLVSFGVGNFRWTWFTLYALLPVALACACVLANRTGAASICIDLAVLILLGLSVDLRWFERAWPAHLSVFNKVLLLDAGIYAFVALRPIEGAGFDLRLRLRDARIGLREFLFYLPIALILGLGTGFLHLHGLGAHPGAIPGRFALAWIFTFFFIAVPEELFFRGWVQNLLERCLGRRAALMLTAVVFGMAHFNKRAVNFNTRYVIMAAIAGYFYGRAWRQDRRVGASAITHATVDSVWSIFLR
ncbi:MAG TPA: CPBP family intramembrane glutamic endopeptidase [Terracidiphilus sp.]|nr:CPBP family intramembrane glutamic endopeptidase [Terracidiphilus sp.]